MGYWDANEQGHSFSKAESGEDMTWGDQPADIVDDAIHKIVEVFTRDVGRLPSKIEIVAGLAFSTNALMGLPDKPSDSPEISEDDLARIETAYQTRDRAALQSVYDTLRKPFREADEAALDAEFKSRTGEH